MYYNWSFLYNDWYTLILGTINGYETGFTFIFGASLNQSWPHDLPFWRCSWLITIWFLSKSHRSFCLHTFPASNTWIQELTVDLLPNISNPLKAAVVTMQSILFTSRFNGFNVVANQCMGNLALLALINHPVCLDMKENERQSLGRDCSMNDCKWARLDEY